MSDRWEDGEVVKTSDDGRYRLRVVPDQDPLNPRENGDFVTNIASPKNTNYIDPEPGGGPYGHIMRHLDNEYRSHDACERFVRAVQMLGGAAYLFDSGGYREGPVLHVVYFTKEAIERLQAENGADWTLDAENWLKAEAKEYTAWAQGDMYGWVLQKNVDWVDKEDPDHEMATWEFEESCFGYYDTDEAEKEGLWANSDKFEAPVQQ